MTDTALKYTPLHWIQAVPFYVSFLLPPLAWYAAMNGGWAVLLVPIIAWYLFTALDFVLGLNTENADPNTPRKDLTLYTWLTIAWVPLQFITLFSLLYYVPQAEHLSAVERIGIFWGVGVITGTIGINYAHELMHQRSKLERWGADILLAMVLYSHFRSEHLLVHHVHVGTPKDPVTARYNESFYRFYPRVLHQCLRSSFRAEKARLAKQNKPWSDLSNPFFRYWALQSVMLGLAVFLGGWSGLALFFFQAGTAIFQLELVNYVEHYGLKRKKLENGKYEHVQPHHSWNAAHRMSNWLLINLQRHSDHHYKPDRKFPVLQTYSNAKAPQLPYGYPLMTLAALIPSLWRRMMHPRVKRWRAKYYPEMAVWSS
jgi:alkane 1-monooxygenase